MQQLKAVGTVLRQHMAVARGEHNRQVVVVLSDTLAEFDPPP